MMLSLIIASQTFEKSFDFSWLKSYRAAFFQVICASLFLGLCAQISIPLYYTPVPLTFQTVGVMLIGTVLGKRKGALSVLLYLLEGCMGLPVFALGGWGILGLLGPRGGYLVGMVFQAYLLGWYMERTQNFNSSRVMGMLLFSSLLMMSLGVVWLGHYVGYASVLMMGFYPFIPGEIVKALAVTTFLRSRAT